MWISPVFSSGYPCVTLRGQSAAKTRRVGTEWKKQITSIPHSTRWVAALQPSARTSSPSEDPELQGRVWGVCLISHRLTLVSPRRLKQTVVPFRDSKLTRVFQGFFTGRGRSCMIVNINQCASTYDETLYVAKFSAIASQVSSTHQDHDMVRIHPASVGMGPFPSQGRENAPKSFLCHCCVLLPLQHFQILLTERLDRLQRSAVFKDYVTSRLCGLMTAFSPSACSGASHKAGTSIHPINHQRAQQANQPGFRGGGEGRSRIRRWQWGGSRCLHVWEGGGLWLVLQPLWI